MKTRFTYAPVGDRRRMETLAKRHLGGFDQIGPSLRAKLVHSAESAPEKSVMVHGLARKQAMGLVLV